MFTPAHKLPHERNGNRMQKVISFGIPCYNSAAYMDHCISSILEGSQYAEDVQIIVVDDGSTKDNTYEKALEWQTRYPTIVKAVHQENGGHGMAVLAGLHNADGVYYKVVDSDDWLDADALDTLLMRLRSFINNDIRVDLVMSNYVYEHVEDNTYNKIDYAKVFPKDRIFSWDEIGHFGLSQYLLMHSLCYRRDVLLDGGLPMPAHTFYVDNIYAYVPLPRCKTLYYLDIDLYRYFIGRDDQSVNEQVLTGRIDHYWRVAKIMIHAYHVFDDITSVKLRNYMLDHLSIVMGITSVFSRLSDRPDAMRELAATWDDMKAFDERTYRHTRHSLVGICTNLPTAAGEKVTIGLYRIAQKLVKFN